MRKWDKIILFAAITFLFFYLFGGGKFFRSFFPQGEPPPYISLFPEVAALVQKDYVEKIDPAKKFPGAFSAMLGQLDIGSAYLDPQKTAVYRRYREGDLYHTGIWGAKVRGYFYISHIVEESPAAEAGLQAGDIIKAVNGRSVYSSSFWEMHLSLFSEGPKTLEVTIFRKKGRKPEKILLETVPLDPSPTFERLREDIFLVGIKRIDGPGVTLLKERLAGRKTPRLILDLRYCAGGDFESLGRLAAFFFKPTDSLVLETQNNREKIPLGTENPLQYKAVIIIGPSTIMYAKLLAALFQAGRVPLAGTRTRGPLVKIRQFDLGDGSSILLPQGFFLLKNRDLNGSVLTPDIEIKEKDTGKIIEKCISILGQTSKD